jgi:hypothetical protein
MVGKTFKRYYKAVIGVMASIILGFVSLLITSDVPASLLVSLVGTTIALCIEIVTSIADLAASLQRNDVEVVSESRARFAQQFLEMKLNATKQLDIFGIALDKALDDFLNEPVILRKAFTGLDVRLLFLDPDGAYMAQRSQEEGITPTELREKLLDSVRRSLQIYEALVEEYKKSGPRSHPRVGSVEIRIIDSLPYCAIFRSDDRLLFGLYLSYGVGVSQTMFEVNKNQAALCTQLDDHFNNLWRHPSSRSLVRFSHYSPRPTANAQVFKELLGVEIPTN